MESALSEKKESNKIVKAGAGYVLGNYLLKGITFLAAPIFTRLLTTSQYGDFSTYISYESIFFIIVGLALHSSINSANYRYKDKINEYVSSIIVLTMLSMTMWYIVVNVFFDAYSSFLDLNRIQVNILVFHCFSTALFQIYNTYVGLSYRYKSFLGVTSFNAIANIVLSVPLIMFVFKTDRTLGRIIGTVIPLGTIGIYIIIYFFKKVRPTINKEYWKFGISYSLPIVPHGISQVILSSFDRIMIKKMVGSSEAGIYSFAYTIYALFKVAATSLENVWKPWVFSKMEDEDYTSIKRQGTNYTIGMAGFTVAVVLASPEIIKILGAKAYWQSTPCVVPVVVGGFFSFLYTIPSVIEYYYGKTKFIAIGTMCAAGLNILLNYFFIAKYGYIAAAYTTLVTYFLYFLFHYVIASKIHGYALFETKKLLGISACVIIMGEISIIMEKIWYARWGLLFLMGILYVLWADKNFGIFARVKKMMK